jgi:WD40 repeat protein
MRKALELQLDQAQEPGHCPAVISDHELVQRIGEGAYGEVWLARNALGSLRAVKIVYHDRFKETRPSQREFQGILKYEPVSRSHDGLIAIFHVGRNDSAGYFYYVMELADDANGPPAVLPPGAGFGAGPAEKPLGYRPRTLHAELARRERLTPVMAAQLTLKLAEALAHLHRNGLVHRDIKPSNVIFVNRNPKLADIGLITTVGDSRSFVGTEGFIPPEGPGTPQADLYGLGKLLYEMVTGRDRLEFPQLPAELTAGSEGEAVLELNEIITRACAPDPPQRYAAATELVADLNLFLAGRSLREARRLERHAIWFKRFALAACGVALLVGLAFAFATSQGRQARERERASQERVVVESALRRRAEAAESAAKQQLYSALLEQARANVRSAEMGQRVRALDAIQRAATISNSAELRGIAVAALALPDLKFDSQITLGAGLTAIQLDPAFERLATCRGSDAIEVLRVRDRQVLARLPPSTNAPAYIVRWSENGRFLAVKRDTEGVGDRADIEVWEVETQKRVLVVRGAAYGTFAFNPRLPRIMASLGGGEVGTWDLLSGQETKRLRLEGDAPFIAIAPDGNQFAAGCEVEGGWTVSVRSTSSGEVRASYRLTDRPAWLAWHPWRPLVLVADFAGWVRLLEPESLGSRILGRHKAQAVYATFSADGRYALTGGWERELVCWDLRNLQKAFLISLDSYQAQIRSDGRQMAVTTSAGLSVYHVELPACHQELAGELGGWLRHGLFSPDARWFAVSGQEKLGVWDLANNAPGAFLPEAAEARLFFAGEGNELYACRDEACFHYQLISSAIPRGPPELRCLEFPVPGGFTSFCSASNRAVLTTLTGSRAMNLPGPLNPDAREFPTASGINRCSADGRWLGIYSAYSSLLRVYDLAQSRPAAELRNAASISEFEFSPDGAELVVASRNSLDFWQTSNWEHTRRITNFMGILFTQPAGPWWMSQDFQHAGLFEARTLRSLLPLPPGMLPLALSPDGTLLAVSVDARRVQVWNLKELQAQLRELGVDFASGG